MVTPVRSSSSIQPLGVQGTNRGSRRFIDSRPILSGMKAIYVLFQADGAEDRLFVDMGGQRKLHQNAMHGRIGVQVPHNGQQFLLADVLRQVVGKGCDANLGAGLLLHAHVAL